MVSLIIFPSLLSIQAIPTMPAKGKGAAGRAGFLNSVQAAAIAETIKKEDK